MIIRIRKNGEKLYSGHLSGVIDSLIGRQFTQSGKRIPALLDSFIQRPYQIEIVMDDGTIFAEMVDVEPDDE